MSLLKEYAKVLNEFALNRPCPARSLNRETEAQTDSVALGV